MVSSFIYLIISIYLIDVLIKGGRTLKKKKLGIVVFEYIIIGSLILIATLGVAALYNKNTETNMEGGAYQLGDHGTSAVWSSENNGGSNTFKITSFTVNPETDISLKIGEHKSFSISVQPQNVWNYKMEYIQSESSKQIVKLEVLDDLHFTLTGLAEGKDIITIRTTDGSKIEKVLIVRVGNIVTDFTIEKIAYVAGA